MDNQRPWPAFRMLWVSSAVSVVVLVTLWVLTGSWKSLYIAMVLSVLEISLSFDNAVVNAKVLAKLPIIWQKRFIIWGLPIAVFGVRLLFPILLVYSTTPISLIEVFTLAWQSPQQYSQLLEQGYPIISGFGGSFLLMVYFHFLFDPQRNVKWIQWIEHHRYVRVLTRYAWSHALCVAVIGVLFTLGMRNMHVGYAFLLGMVVFLLLQYLNHSFIGNAEALANLAKQGLVGFLYLEVLDASFSIDGVLGAFALSTNIFIILVGLGIGALFVRSLTIMILQNQILKRYMYLEHGAFYAIGFLGLVLLLKNIVLIPEWVAATIGLLCIIVAVVDSKRQASAS